ncbi:MULTISPECIES: isopentenyl transferase family protein [unclassified Brenneria]|uniref:isopentenyl transferase family protein n=1 Tax=unclassified Brenneria TaxID=2634434 RepID=UPI001552F248|nr:MULTISPECIES: isopentenyl transferase family protein [unclassified Brenneria]MBJ7223649.1 isopentenyl transferase [Brenneria sp. L3-3C-1]MEE3644891.1 isopentenyl transferase family protein [Brenneria sp. L3_3C_1]MEE3652359.1 isopentenyl transferase family protein [Brenneria sp. HEZEL_4_2_4]NPD02316.1 isopentenyl transferase [Brenneria sp. hezel4-2-4]
MKKTLYLIWGPTSTGKTSYSVSIAKTMGYPVIALDRFQGYPEIMTGSGAPTMNELQGTDRIYLSENSLNEGIISAEEANTRLKEKISFLSTQRPGIIIEGGSVSLLVKIMSDNYWSNFSWRIKIFQTPPSDQFHEKAKKRVYSMFFPDNGRPSILKETSLFFDTYKTVQPLEDIDGYRVIIQYGRDKGLNFHALDNISDKEKYFLIDLITDEYFEHALWQEKNYPGIPSSWSWQACEVDRLPSRTAS